MKLAKWLEENQVTVSTFAALIGVTPGAIVHYINEEGRPSLKNLKKIHVLTQGQVSVMDFAD